MFSYISADKLNNIKDGLIIDIRSSNKYSDGHILNAVNIFSDILLKNPYNYLDKGSKYYIYCQKGHKSLQVCKLLSSMGFNIINIDGGYEAWILNN